jgi:hypothetical protein
MPEPVDEEWSRISDAVRASYAAQRQAMLAGDAGALGVLLW